LFFAEAVNKGFNISLPFGDNCAYDCVLDSGSKLSRIQIKSTSGSEKNTRSSSRYAFNLKHSINNIPYSSNQVDYYALVCLDLRVFYIIPQSVLADQKTAKCWPTVLQSTGKWEKFKECWHLL